MSGTAGAKRVESRREEDTFTASNGDDFAVPPVPWRARNKLADLVLAQNDDSIARAIVTEKDDAGKEVTTYHTRDSAIDYMGILALGLGEYRDPITPEPLSDALTHRIEMLPYQDLVGLTTAVLERNGLERLVYQVDLGKPRPESLLETLGFVLVKDVTDASSDDGQRTSSAPDSSSPDSPNETPTS